MPLSICSVSLLVDWRQLALSIIDLFGVVVLVPGIIKYVNLVPTFEADQELKDRWIGQSVMYVNNVEDDKNFLNYLIELVLQCLCHTAHII